MTASGDVFDMESGGGHFIRDDWRVLRIGGPDARDFLHRLSTLDFRSFSGDRARAGAFLNGKGGVISWGYFLADAASEFLFVVPPGAVEETKRHLEMLHFREDLRVSDEERFVPVAVLGCEAPSADSLSFDGVTCRSWEDGHNPRLRWCLVPRKELARFTTALGTAGFPTLGEDVFRYLRLRHGTAYPGAEVTPENIVLEANLDRAVDRNKGCYPGQEVVERIYTYGSVNKKLFVLRLSGPPSSIPAALRTGDEPAGTLVAAAAPPAGENAATVGLAYIARKYWDAPRFITDSGTACDRLE